MRPESQLLTVGLRILREYGVPIEGRNQASVGAGDRQGTADAEGILQVGGESRPVDIVCRKGLRPGNAGLIAAESTEAGRLRLLIADHVSRPMGERLRNLGIAFVDMAGNAWLDVPPVLVRVEGRKPVAPPESPVANRAFHRTGLQVVFALLCKPQLFRAPLRDIAEATGVAHGTVGWVMHGLRDAGYLIERGKGRGRKRYPRKLNRLLDEWAAAYARTLRPSLLQGRYAPGPGTERDWWRKADLETQAVLLGGEPAAAEMTGYLQPGGILLYATQLPGRLIAEQRLVLDGNGEIEFRHRFWPFDHDGDRPDLVPPALVYADLLAMDEPRCVETARMIHERYLAEPLGQY